MTAPSHPQRPPPDPVGMESSPASTTSSDYQVGPMTARIDAAVENHIYIVHDLFAIVFGPHDQYDGPTWADDRWGKEAEFKKRVDELSPDHWFTRANTPLPGSVAVRKPDFITVHDVDVNSLSQPGKKIKLRALWAEDLEDANSNRAKATWYEAASAVELKDGGQSEEGKLHAQGLRIGSELLRQPGRLFALVLTIRKEDFRLLVASASGVFQSRIVKATEEPKLVAHALSKLPYLAPRQYGLDLGLCPVARGQHAHPVPHVPGYSLTRVLRPREHIVGRCTTVFRLDPTHPQAKKDPVVLKLAFLDTKRKASTTEAKVLDAIERAHPGQVAGLVQRAPMRGLPKILPWSTDKVLGMGQATFGDLPNSKGEKNMVVRELEAVLIRPVGISCTRYTSALHFWRGVIAAVEAHRRLFDLGYLHRDISTGNIVIPTDPKEAQGGYLIDYDLTTKIDEEPSGAGHRTGTYPFLALDLLDDPSTRHEVRHDLESFFYVVIWVCSIYGEPAGRPADACLTEDRLSTAPGLSRGATAPALSDMPVRKWDQYDPEGAWDTKNNLVTLPNRFDRFQAKIDPYWRPLVDGQVFDGLRQVVQTLVSGQPGTVDEQYDGFLAALNRGLHVLQQQEQQ